MDLAARPAANIGKFRDPDVTASGAPRARDPANPLESMMKKGPEAPASKPS